MIPENVPIVFFDGPCGLCQRSVKWLVRHERPMNSKPKLHFASLQSDLASDALPEEVRTPPLEGLVFRSGTKCKVGASAVRAWRLICGGPIVGSLLVHLDLATVGWLGNA